MLHLSPLSALCRCLLVASITLAVPACTATPALPGEGDDRGRTVVYRDTWGVPHIYAPSVESALYAVGYAQAQDRPHQLLLNFKMAIGEFASVVGPQGLPVDLRAHMWDHYNTARTRYDSLPEELRLQLQAYVEGINRFYTEHPQDRPEWWGDAQVDTSMVIAFGRMFLFNWSIDEAYGDLKRSGVSVEARPPQRASNQFAVAPARSAEGAAILAIDPHLSWDGPSRFWELRVHADTWHGSGVTLPGFPFIGLGHNRHIAWAMTTGGPDTADVYELRLDPSDSGRYLYDGEWRQLTSRTIRLEVREQEPVERTLLFSHHGPVIATRGNKAYAARMSYADVVDASRAWSALNFAKDYRGAIGAMEQLNVFPQNVMVADTSGNIYYQRTGRVPRRSTDLDWSRAVDGSTSASQWQGMHPSSDHLQVLNPAAGYMQNCNVPPDAMLPDGPFANIDRAPYLYGSQHYGPVQGWTNQRGARAVELLSADSSVTAQDAIRYITDVSPSGIDRWIEVLVQADRQSGRRFQKSDHYRPALQDLVSWDLQMTADSTAALKFDYWKRSIREHLGEERANRIAAEVDDLYAIIEGRPPRQPALQEEQLTALLEAFDAAMQALVDRQGRLDATFGDRYRVGRGEKNWPVGGGGGAPGTTSLRAMGYGPERDDQTRWGRRGQTSTQVVVLTEPPRSWLYLPVGQSDRPESPHFSDQAEQLFQHRKLKESWWLPQDLAQHIESRTVLDVGR